MMAVLASTLVTVAATSQNGFEADLPAVAIESVGSAFGSHAHGFAKLVKEGDPLFELCTVGVPGPDKQRNA